MENITNPRATRATRPIAKVDTIARLKAEVLSPEDIKDVLVGQLIEATVDVERVSHGVYVNFANWLRINHPQWWLNTDRGSEQYKAVSAIKKDLRARLVDIGHSNPDKPWSDIKAYCSGKKGKGKDASLQEQNLANFKTIYNRCHSEKAGLRDNTFGNDLKAWLATKGYQIVE